MSEGIIYECLKCGKVSTKEEWERTGVFKCSECGFRVAKKIRPPVAKRVKAI